MVSPGLAGRLYQCVVSVLFAHLCKHCCLHLTRTTAHGYRSVCNHVFYPPPTHTHTCALSLARTVTMLYQEAKKRAKEKVEAQKQVEAILAAAAGGAEEAQEGGEGAEGAVDPVKRAKALSKKLKKLESVKAKKEAGESINAVSPVLQSWLILRVCDVGRFCLRAYWRVVGCFRAAERLAGLDAIRLVTALKL